MKNVLVLMVMIMMVACGKESTGGAKWSYTDANKYWEANQQRQVLDLSELALQDGEIFLREAVEGDVIVECKFTVKERMGTLSDGYVVLELKEGYLFLCNKYLNTTVKYTAVSYDYGVQKVSFGEMNIQQ